MYQRKPTGCAKIEALKICNSFDKKSRRVGFLLLRCEKIVYIQQKIERTPTTPPYAKNQFTLTNKIIAQNSFNNKCH